MKFIIYMKLLTTGEKKYHFVYEDKLLTYVKKPINHSYICFLDLWHRPNVNNKIDSLLISGDSKYQYNQHITAYHYVERCWKYYDFKESNYFYKNKTGALFAYLKIVDIKEKFLEEYLYN